MTGAAAPMAAWDGVSARTATEMPISVMLSSIAGLRPCRSAHAPMAHAPSGRPMKPTPNVASEAIRLTKGSSDGKKTLPIWMAKKLNVMKS